MSALVTSGDNWVMYKLKIEIDALDMAMKREFVNTNKDQTLALDKIRDFVKAAVIKLKSQIDAANYTISPLFLGGTGLGGPDLTDYANLVDLSNIEIRTTKLESEVSGFKAAGDQ
mmetsp:Transcript_1679/g.2401  ORF Transcript_1679/g.2401 Transcript_1679/m.2401 type:complete len:115 (-) Transcript_1679:1313-1657(-)